MGSTSLLAACRPVDYVTLQEIVLMLSQIKGGYLGLQLP
jgi:hypothetical protein